MSFTNNFLKALQEKGVSTTNNAGGSTPSASSENSSSGSGGNNYTSNFLSALQKQKNMTISERAEAKAQALLKKQQEQARTPAGILSNYGRNHSGPTTSGGYYSRPELGSYSERLYGNITALEPVLTEKRAALDTAQTSLVQAETDLKTVQGYLQQARAVYDADPTNENATSYNQIVGAYNLAYDAYASAFKTYSTAYDAYKPYEDQLIDALAIYQLYSNQQQAAFDDWRGTIRDAATIQTEITAIDQQMADLEVAEAAAAEAARQQQLAEYQARQDAKPWYEKLAGYLGGVQDTTLPLAGVTPGTVEAAFNQPEKTPSREMQQLIAMKELLQEELNWSQYYYYADFAGAPDFAEMSKYVPQEEKEQRALDIMLDNYSSDAAPWEDPLYEYINGNEEAGAWLSNAGANYYGPDNAIGAFFGRATENKAESQQMTEQEVATFNYLYATQGKAAAHAYYDYLLADLNYRQRKSEEEYWAAEAAKNPVGTSVFSVVMSPAKGLSYIGQLGDWLPDHELEPNAAYNKFSYTNTAIRSQVAKQIEESGKWGKVGSFAYQTGMSMADFLLNTAVTGGNQALSLAIMGTGAAADATIAAKDRGLTDDQSFALGTIAGLAEVATEKVSLEVLLNPEFLRDGTVKYILKNMLAEGSEEVGSDLINLVADIAVSKDQSEWAQSVNSYMDQGKTEAEAFGLAIADQAATLGLDFLGGAISGGIMSSVNAGINNNYTKKIGEDLAKIDLSEEDVQAFIQTGLESAQDSEAYAIAKEMQKKLDKGKTLSDYDLARLWQANAQTIQAEEESGDGQDGGEEADENELLDGLNLRSLDDDVQAVQSDPLNTRNIAQIIENDTEGSDSAPLSVAERLRQEQNLNGGVQNADEQENGLRLGAAFEGNDVSDGNGGWNDGQSAGEQAGVLAGGTRGRSAGQTAFASRAAIDRQSRAKNLRLEKVSSLDLGLQNGTEARNIQVMPQENWDAEMSQLADRIYNETGKSVTYVMGRIQIRGTGGTVGYARGVITGDRIIVQADHLRISMEQIADHEAYHAKAGFTGGRLNDEIRRHIVETFSEEQYRAVLETYVKQLRCVYNLTEAKTVEEYEETLNIIEEEIFADAYAGINAFGTGADQFTGAVNEKMDQLYMGKIRNQDNGTEEPTGPPSDRYSFAGENANNADLDALARAKEMQAAGVADETIRQQTGWHTGMDGKWRWEIDDSGMQYTSRGDLGLRERRPEYARYRELLDKSNRYVLELSDEALTPEETAELQKLKEIWGGTFRKAGRITEDALPTELLSDYVKHDALFEAYPQLRKTRLRFADLPEGTRGQYDPEQDVITLSESLRGKPQDTLIHEIQHVIQKAEGFAQGSSPEFWDGQQVVPPEYASEIQKAEDTVKKVEAEFHQEWPDDINLNLVKQYIELDNQLWGDGTDPIALQELADQMDQIEQLATESGWGDLFNDYYYAVGQLQMAKERAKLHRRASIDLYRNTAGEIEARDAASRRQLTPEQRRSTEPARADDRTVFVEDVDETVLAEMDAEYGPQLQPFFGPDLSTEEIDGNIQQVAQMEPVTSISGQEFAKGEVDLITQVETFFNQRGNRAYSPELGEVILDRKGVKSDIAHGIGRKKAAAFAAVPDVIEHGLVVDYQKDWKGRGYDTAVVAAPITIGDQTHAAAVILLRSDQTNRFYVHEVLAMENGALPFKTGTREGYPGGDAPSILSILDKIRSVKNGTGSQERFSVDDSDDLSLQLGERFSVDDVDSHGHSLTPEQQEFYAQSQARDGAGRLLVLYHQTDGDFTIFDTRHPGAGSRDSETPFGIFLKQTAGDIGLAGKKQMALYANITNPLRAANREDLARQLREISGSYAAISDKHKQLDAQYHEKFEQAKKAWRDYIIEWRAANPGANRSALNDDPKFNELFDAEDAVVDEWTAAADLLSTQAKEAITEDLRKAGYDGVFLENDVGSWGRRTDAIIALDPQQVKNISNKTPTSNPDIRYSVDDTDSHGNTLSAAQQEYFKYSKIRDKQGRLLVMYHGTMHGGFTVFDGGKDYWYFTNDRKYSYTFEGRKGNGHLYPSTRDGIDAGYYTPQRYKVYLNVTNPFVTNDSGVVEDALYWDRTLAGKLREKGYDALMLEDMSQVIVLNANQIKNTTNRNPSTDSDIRYSVDDGGTEPSIGELQTELYQLQHQRRSLLEADTAYAAAADNLRYANTFTEKVAARKAMAAAAANIDTAAIDQRIFDLNEQISEIRNRETRRHREDQEKYSGTKTAGYSTMPDTRLKDLDQDYMKAVRSGDRIRMAELVEQAAEAAMPASVVRDKSGRLLKTYHHTGNRFTVFDRNMARTGTEMDGFFFAPDPDSTSEYGSNMITAYLNITKLAMDPKLDRKFNDSGTLLREKLAYQGYDGMARTENGEIYEYMTFDPEQIKSADPVVYDDRGRVVPLSERFNFSNPDIRYSVDDGGQDPAQQQPAAPKKKIRPVAESRPLIAKKDLRNTVLNLFSIPNGQRAEVGAMIDSYADRLIKNGSLTEDDRKAFFDRMYDAGVMVMPADEYSAYARSHIADGRIYVSDSVKADFGDDWADIRRRAFAAGVYLVNDRSASGIDQWNATLSAEDMLPGLFDSEETDERTILERILQVAEEGKDEHLSLAEYTRRLSQQEGISEDEFLDNMERQLDWALRTFAEKARLEVHLRDRTGRKIAQEREKGAERMTRQQAKEAQRRADERQARKDSARRAKERRELRELQQRTLKQLQWLSKNRFRAPEELQATWDEVLSDIDIYAISAADEMRWSDKHNATWKDLAQMYKDAMKNDPNFLPSKELERIVTRLDATKIADMDLGALQDLYKAAIGLRTEFYNRNNVINDEMQRLFAEVYTDAKREIESAPGGFTGGVADKFLNLDQLTPMNVLQRMAGWDPDGAFYSMAKQLERGERDMRAYSVKAQKMLQDFLTEHEDWVKKADGQGKDAIWYEVEVPQLLELGMGDKPIFGPTVKVYMTPAQKVHMFLESKNLDNLRHMTGGRTFVNKDLYSQGKRQEALSQGRTIKLAPETVRKLVSDLTPEEMELAQILDRYYNTFATQEINKVSNILYGYDKAMGKNYAPIYTNRNYTKTEFGVFDTTAEGVGNLKGRQYAVNPSYNISAFDAFERHVDQTARFCGMAIPARNWTTLMNWREKNNSTGDVITHKWGEESKRYITDLITTLQGGDDAKTDTVSSLANKIQSNYISAVFGANPSIVLKQLGSIPLAGAYLDARNMPTPAQISKIDRSLISKYTQELEWRTMGYATPETKQLKDNPNWTQTNKAFKFVFGGGAITAMDGWAASTLWPWAENKVRREHPELAVGTKAQVEAGESAFYKKVAEEFEIAVSRSQSVSDEIHQGSLRKSKNPITKAFTMFRSDSAQTYNALRQKIGEARYYMRIGARENVIKTAKKAAGTAFVAMLINAAWSEAVSFLMALWKNKGKYYRDDEDELTFQSVAGEMASNMLGSFAGVVTFGEEVFEVIGNILTGEKIYDIETPGMEQLNDLIDAVTTAGGGMRDLVAGGWDVLKNGGNLGDYFSKHSGEMLGGIKDLAEAAAVYLSGMPVSNLEAYLTGALKWVSPELGAAYDDLFSDTGKSDLTGVEGSALEGRIGRILSDRNVSESNDTAAALAALYEAGYKTAVPSDTPISVSIDGEKHSLGDYQQQAYDTIWGGIVADALDDMVASDSFKEADPKTQAKMLENLYDYAAERAKAELFDEYEMDTGAAENAAIVAAGATVAECITWNTITSGKNPDGTAKMKSGEKAAELASWNIPEEAKREIFRSKISDSREGSIAAFDEAGLSFDQFLQAYSMYGQINNEDLKAGMKAVEFSHWVNAQGYTAEQAAVVKDELTYFNMTPASSSRYDELVGSGMDPDEAYDLTGALNELQPEDGADEVSDLQKWRASVDFSDDVEDQLAALSAVMTDAQFQKVEIANNFGVSPDAYVTLQEIKPQYDADGNGSYKNAEIKAAVDGLPGYYTTEQKAVLWQLATGSTSARNNPYSRQVGQQVLDARAAAKEAAAQEQTEAPTDSTDDDSFSQALLDQLLGRG